MQRFAGAKELSQHGVHTFDTCALRNTLLATSSGRVGWNVAAMATTARSRAQSSGVLGVLLDAEQCNGSGVLSANGSRACGCEVERGYRVVGCKHFSVGVLSA
jgi:hypothetical protein